MRGNRRFRRSPARHLLRLALGRRLPVTRGRIELAGPGSPIVIRRDRWGIPHIEARSEFDAWFGLGFCQGQDRAFQLEVLLRVVRGTLAEVLGPEALPADRISRRIGFYREAKRRMAVLDAASLLPIDAYALGVTRGASEGSRRRAHEFVLIGSRPTPFTAADSAGVLAVLSFALASNWDSEMTRLRLLLSDGRAAVESLDPRYPSWLPVTAPSGLGPVDLPERLGEDLGYFIAALGPGGLGGGGSNNWALAPRKTASGRPILANDPHLTPILPAHWYLSHLKTPEWSAAGASFVGTPGITVGHNGRIAWGITAGLSDNTDLFVEEVGRDGRSVRSPDGFRPCEVTREVIRVRRGPDVIEDVLITPRGPLIEPPARVGDRRGLSIRAVWLDPLPIRGILHVHRSRTLDEFRAWFADWPVLPLNLVFAEAGGSIGWQLAGAVPIRRKGSGLAPLAGWDPAAGWRGLVPFEEMPGALDPAGGFVASANTAPLSTGDGPWLGGDWIDGYRLARIREALESRDGWTVAGTQELQLDTASIPWREVRGAVLSAPAAGRAGQAALDALRSWDGDVGAGSPGAAVFELLIDELVRMAAEAQAPRGVEWALGKGHTVLSPRSSFAVRRVGHLSRLLRERPEGWFDRSWEQVIAEAAAAAVLRLEKLRGPDPSRWAWGRIRRLTLQHPFGARRALRSIWNLGPIPCGGDTNTIAQVAVDPLDPVASPLYIASLRAVIDVGRWDLSRFALPGGQSGNPLSPHYDDQLPLWIEGKGVPIAWTDAEVAAAAREELLLAPGGGTGRDGGGGPTPGS